MSQSKKFGFTLIELLVVISIIALLLGILVPVLGKAKRSANLMKESTSSRNVGLALNVFASSNKDWFPGLNAAGQYSPTDFTGKYYFAAKNGGTLSGGTVPPVTSIGTLNNYAEAVSLDEGGTNPAQWISSNETSQSKLNASAAITAAVAAPGTTPTATSGNVSSNNNSFAVVNYGVSTLKSEWKSVQNQQAVILGSRVIDVAAGFTAGAGFNTTWTDQGSGKFQGATTRGDNSTSLDVYANLADMQTAYGTLKFGSVAAQAGTPVAATMMGIYGLSALDGGADNTKFGNTQSAGSYTLGQIGSANN